MSGDDGQVNLPGFSFGNNAQLGDVTFHIQNPAHNPIPQRNLLPRPFAEYDRLYEPPEQAKDLLERVKTTPGYTLVAAEPTYGKSAMTRWMYHQIKNQFGNKYPIIAYRFSYLRPQSLTEVRSYLIDQIRQLIGDSTDLPETDLYAWLQKGANGAQPSSFAKVRLVMLIDGLDECSFAHQPELEWLLPSQLPEGIVVLLTMRSSYRMTLRTSLTAEHPLSRLEPIQLKLLNYVEILKLLNERYGVIDFGGIARYIHTVTQGAPISVRDLCDIAQEADRHNRNILLALKDAGSSPSLAIYFAQNVKRFVEQGETHSKQELLHDLLYLIALLDRVNVHSAAAILHCELAYMQHVLRRETTIVLKRAGDLTLFLAPRFADYLAQSDHAERRQQIDQQLEVWTQTELAEATAANPLHTDVVRYLLQRLQNVSQWETYNGIPGWKQQIQQMIWQYPQRETLTFLYRKVLHDLRFGRQATHTEAFALLIGVGLLLAQPPRYLIPELVILLVREQFWTREQATTYVQQSYRSTLNGDHKNVEQLLFGNEMLALPAALLPAGQELQSIRQLHRAQQNVALGTWIATWEQKSPLTGKPPAAQSFRDLRETLNDARRSEIDFVSTTDSGHSDDSAEAHPDTLFNHVDRLLRTDPHTGKQTFLNLLDELLPWRDGLTSDDALTGLSILAPVIVRYAPESLGLIDRVIALVADLVSEE